MHEAFFFGPPDDQVFAIYHPPSGSASSDLVVICPPLFAEYMRTHLALRELAISLAERGRHVIRFDYRGTGDSARDLAEVSVSDWVEDIVHAVDEGRELSGSRATRLIGVRAGALLACQAATKIPDLAQLLMWDPVSTGSSYLASCRAMQQRLLARNRATPRKDRVQAANDYAGHALTATMVSGLSSLGEPDLQQVPAMKIGIVATTNASIAGMEAVPTHAEPYVCNWERDGEEIMMPQPVLERLIALVTGE